MARATIGSRDPVLRALDVLEALAREGRELGVTEIAQKVSLNKSTVHRLLQSMVAAGFVIQGKQEGAYRASLKLCELGNLVLECIDLRNEASPHLKQLAARTGETAHLVTLDDCYGVYIDKVDSVSTIRMVSRIGRRIPLYCTAVGKVLLAGLPAGEREDMLRRTLAAYGSRRFTPNTLVDVASLVAHLDRVAAQGYALDCEENESGVMCVAAPIRNHESRVVAACSVSGPIFRLAASRVEALIPAVVATACEISRCLGHTISSDRTVRSELDTAAETDSQLAQAFPTSSLQEVAH
jgi:IclR family transcriptional regulator, KDG regulon repressor